MMKLNNDYSTSIVIQLTLFGDARRSEGHCDGQTVPEVCALLGVV